MLYFRRRDHQKKSERKKKLKIRKEEIKAGKMKCKKEAEKDGRYPTFDTFTNGSLEL